jgi:hypothetical protein
MNVLLLITAVVRSKVWTAFAHLSAGIVGSNPTQGMDLCMRLFCVCAVLGVGSGLATGWSPVQGVLPTVYRIKKVKKWPRSEGLWSHKERGMSCNHSYGLKKQRMKWDKKPCSPLKSTHISKEYSAIIFRVLDDGRTTFSRNAGGRVPDYTAVHTRR